MEGVHFMNCRRGVEVHFNLALEGVFRTMFEVQRFKGPYFPAHGRKSVNKSSPGMTPYTCSYM